MEQRESEKTCSVEAIKETLSFIRAHSTIRFVALPFFLGASALIANKFLGSNTAPIDLLLATSALGLSVVGAVVEVILSRNLIAWWHALRPLLDANPPWQVVAAHRDGRALKAARWALFAPYPASFCFWLFECVGLVLRAPAGIAPERHRIAVGLIAVTVSLAMCLAANRVWRAAATSPR